MADAKKRLLLAILFGMALGILGGCGTVIHDGENIRAGVITGAALFALGFGVVYSRCLRRIAELVSAIH
jgi:membrane associated rhomboid family serine protease